MNPQSLASHERWAQKFGFQFPICSDGDGAVCTAFGVLKENGKSVQRTVYAIAKDGTIVFAERGMPDNDAILGAIEGTA